MGRWVAWAKGRGAPARPGTKGTGTRRPRAEWPRAAEPSDPSAFWGSRPPTPCCTPPSALGLRSRPEPRTPGHETQFGRRHREVPRLDTRAHPLSSVKVSGYQSQWEVERFDRPIVLRVRALAVAFTFRSHAIHLSTSAWTVLSLYLREKAVSSLLSSWVMSIMSSFSTGELPSRETFPAW